ncbi:hypothetical protein PanWU01x14_276150 [Parasponia andersonii]|uniref:Uncharacterized protein n=1 Tax=Parasponia andersonii TaxID=3476 RepID=A0A2P5B2X6_PARAD|nr:hypothetical protein PanWU01x14_276150 [Parasponia andersonii]
MKGKKRTQVKHIKRRSTHSLVKMLGRQLQHGYAEFSPNATLHRHFYFYFLVDLDYSVSYKKSADFHLYAM